MLPLTDKTVDLYGQMCSIFPETPIGQVFSSFDDHYASNDFVQRYINDFLKMAHKCNHADPIHMDREYKVSEAIPTMHAIKNCIQFFHFLSYFRQPLQTLLRTATL